MSKLVQGKLHNGTDGFQLVYPVKNCLDKLTMRDYLQSFL